MGKKKEQDLKWTNKMKHIKSKQQKIIKQKQKNRQCCSAAAQAIKINY